MKVIRIYSTFLVSFSLLFIHCEQIETEIQIAISVSERVPQDVKLYALIFNSSPDLSSIPTNYAKRIPLFKTSEAPKIAIIPDLTVDEAIYILLFANINDDGELNISGGVITEPIGGFGISPESSQLTPLTIIEGMETIDIIIYHPEEIFGTYGEIPLDIEPLGIYGATPRNPEPPAINTSQDTTGLDITIYNITELYGNYVATISGTVTIDKNKYYR